MGYDTTPLTESSTFDANVHVPLTGTPVESGDVAIGTQSLANRTKYLNDTKFDKAGGAVTGSVEFDGAATFDNTAEFNGSVTFDSTAEFNGSAQFDAAVALNAGASVPSGQAITLNVARLVWTGAQPAVSADPGANTLHATNFAKAFAQFVTDGVGGVIVVEGFNIASAAVVGNSVVLTLARTMNGSYTVSVTHMGGTVGIPSGRDTSGTTVTVTLYDASFVAQDLGAIITRLGVVVHGRQ